MAVFATNYIFATNYVFLHKKICNRVYTKLCDSDSMDCWLSESRQMALRVLEESFIAHNVILWKIYLFYDKINTHSKITINNDGTQPDTTITIGLQIQF